MPEGIAAYFPQPNGPPAAWVARMFTTTPTSTSSWTATRIMADSCLGEEGKWGVKGSGWHLPVSLAAASAD